MGGQAGRWPTGCSVAAKYSERKVLMLAPSRRSRVTLFEIFFGEGWKLLIISLLSAERSDLVSH